MENIPLDSPEPKQKEPLSQTAKLMGINLVFLLLSTLVIGLTNRTGAEAGLGFLILEAMLIAVQVGFNVLAAIVGFVTDRNDWGKAFLASAAVVLVVGFSACFGWAGLMY